MSEIRQLSAASKAFDEDVRKEQEIAATNRPRTGTMQAYYDLLKKIKEQCKIHLSVKIDLLSGTSAGGLNAVILSKALLTGSSVRPLNEFWLNETDVSKLQFTPGILHQGLNFGLKLSRPFSSVTTAIIRFLTGKNLDSEGWLFPRKWLTQLPQDFLEYLLQALLWNQPVFDGTNALQQYAKGIASLMPAEADKYLVAEDELSLFTTFTDLISLPNPLTKEKQHSMVLRFEKEDFTENDINRELAFAMRATSAFPIAFPGVTLRQAAELEMKDHKGEDIPEVEPASLFLKDQLHRWAADYPDGNLPDEMLDHEMADGGILRNKPFHPIVEELNENRRSSGANVQRRILYVEPSPTPYKEIPESVSPPAAGQSSIPDVSAKPQENLFNIGDLGNLPEKFQKRYEALHDLARKRKEKPNNERYEWIGHGLKTGLAVFTQPIEDEVRRLMEFNENLTRVNEFRLRSMFHVKTEVAPRLTQGTLLGDKPMTKIFWHGDPSPLPSTLGLEKLRKMLYFTARTFSSPSQHRIYLDARFQEFRASISKVLASKKYLNFPEGCVKRAQLEKNVRDFFKHPKLDCKDIQGVTEYFKSLVENDLFFLRDMLFSTVRFLENPLWMLDQNEKLCEQLADVEFTKLINRLSEILQKEIDELDDKIQTPQTPPGGINPNWASLDEDKVNSVRKNWTGKFDETFTAVLVAIENELGKPEAIRLPPEARRLLRQLVYRPMFLHSYFESASFAGMCAISMGDNAVTKTVRLSPDNTGKKSNDNEPDTDMFAQARKKITDEGLVAFSDVILRSNDLFFFGGFLERDYREFDIVWGRLDGSEQLCQVLFDVVQDEINRECDEANIMFGNWKNASIAANAAGAPVGPDKSIAANAAGAPVAPDKSISLPIRKPLDRAKHLKRYCVDAAINLLEEEMGQGPDLETGQVPDLLNSVLGQVPVPLNPVLKRPSDEGPSDNWNFFEKMLERYKDMQKTSDPG
jgi:predicted acylesterase/phospholipase RssA